MKCDQNHECQSSPFDYLLLPSILMQPNFLKKLKEEGLDDYYQIRDAIDALQEDFRPKTAIALSQPDLYRMAVTKYLITYHVDNERQRIEVIEIVDGGKEGK